MSNESVKPAEILMEEELYAIENSYALYTPALAERYPDVVNLIASHRELFKANAELSFKNNKYKTALHEITQVDTDYYEDDAKLMTKFAEDALEELK